MTDEPEIQDGNRAFATAQSLLAGVALERLPNFIDVSWHGTVIQPLTGSFAVVKTGGSLTDLIGEVLAVTNMDRKVYVYCLGSADIPTELAVTRRAFFALGLLALTSLPCVVEIVR